MARRKDRINRDVRKTTRFKRHEIVAAEDAADLRRETVSEFIRAAVVKLARETLDGAA